jgi:hypothetical protein
MKIKNNNNTNNNLGEENFGEAVSHSVSANSLMHQLMRNNDDDSLKGDE